MNNDLISRSALKEVLERYLYAPHVRLGGSMCEGMRMAIKTCISLMENAKPVDAVEVVHGKWEMDGKNHCHCTNCKDGRNIETQIGWNFCPNCGADMRGRKGDDG